MVHRFDGLRFMADARANGGLRTARLRVLSGRPVRGRSRSVLSVMLLHSKADLRNAARVGRCYLKPRDWPRFALMLLLVRALELPGILRGLAGHAELRHTAYR